MSVLVIVEHDNLSVKASTLNTVSAAREISDQVTLLIAGENCQPVVDLATKIEGVKSLIVADHATLTHQMAEDLAELVFKVSANGFTHILAPATSTGKDFMPRVAALLDCDQISDVIKIVSEDTFERPIYAGNAIATVTSSAPIKVITVRTTAFDPVSNESGDASVESLTDIPELGLSSFVKDEVAELERPELTSANIVVSGGRGLQSSENFKILESLADKLGAALGASRAAVDAGYVPNDLQVGQTGKIVAPQLYIAVGISGAIQHLAGMKDSKVIVAINKDEDAPIFQVADYGLVADLFEAVPELEKLLD